MNWPRSFKRNVLGLGLGEPCFQSRGMVSFIGKTILRLVSEGRGLKVRKTWLQFFKSFLSCSILNFNLFESSGCFLSKSKWLVHSLQNLSRWVKLWHLLSTFPGHSHCSVLACMPQLLHLLRAEGLHASKANRQQEAHVLRKALSALGSNSCDDVPQVSAIGNDHDQVSRILFGRYSIYLSSLATNIKSCDKEYQWSSTEQFPSKQHWTKHFVCYTSNKKSMWTLYHSKTAGPVAHVQTPRMRPLN